MIQHHNVDGNGVQLHYAEAPGPGAGLLFVHGTTGSHISFLPFMPALAAHAHVYALDLRSGNIKWKYNTNRRVTSSAAIDENLIFIGSADRHLYGINARSGWPVWRFHTKGYVLSTPSVMNGVVYVSSADGHLYAVNHDGLVQVVRLGEKGEIVGTSQIDAGILASPAVADRAIYFRSDAHLWKVAFPIDWENM